MGTLKDERRKATAGHAGSAQVPGTLGGLLELRLFLDMRDVQNPDRKRQLAGFEVICRPSLPGHRGKLEEGWRDFPSRLPPWHAACLQMLCDAIASLGTRCKAAELH